VANWTLLGAPFTITPNGANPVASQGTCTLNWSVEA